MDIKPDIVNDDEISLFDIYDFIRDGWMTLLGLSVLGLLIGVIYSLSIPAKYQANASIDSGLIGSVEAASLDGFKVSSRPVENVGVLAEIMKSPSFYSDQVLKVCGLTDSSNSRVSLVAGLSPSVVRNSNFVSVSYQAESVSAAKACLESVLTDIVANQQPKITGFVNFTKTEIANAQSELDQARQTIQIQQSDRDERLAVARDQLDTARQELRLLSQSQGNDGSAADTNNAVQVLNKRFEVQELESTILGLQSNFNQMFSDRYNQVSRLTHRLAALQATIEPLNTREAQFVTPVFAPDNKVSPRRSLIVVISLLLGGFLGLVVLIGRRAMKHIRAHEAERRAKALTAQ